MNLENTRALIQDAIKDIHTCLPGKIKSFDPATGNADVEILVERLDEPFPILKDVRVWMLQTEQYSITLPVKPGDRCLVFFAELSTSQYRATGSKQKVVPAQRPHQLSNGFCIPGFVPDGSTPTIDPDNLVIQRQGGATLTLTSTALEVDGDLTVDGDITATGEVTAKFGTPSSVGLSTHQHATGVGPSGPPTPGT